MNKRIFMAVIIVLAFLFSLTAGMQVVKLAKANFTPLPTPPAPIYIRSDGSVDPSTAPLQMVADTYKLTNNINNTIEIQLSNTVLDGNGFTITKPAVNTEGLMIPIGWLPGISLFSVSNITIVNATLQDCITGIKVENSTNITINQNAIKGGTDGIAVFSSIRISIVNNNIQSSSTGIHFLPSNPNAIDSREIKIEQNLIFGTGNGISGKIINSQITDNNLTGMGTALNYAGSNNLITRNIFQYSDCGIWFIDQLAVNSTIFRNDFDHNSRNVVIPFIRDPPFNHWDNGTVGNYWSDYRGTDLNRDGIGDSCYIFQTVYFDYELGKNVTLIEGSDNYPLMTPVTAGNIAADPSQSPSLPSSPSPNPSSSPTPTPSKLTNPSPSPTSSPSESTLPTQQPTSSPNQQPRLQRSYYLVAAVAAVVIVVAVALALRSRSSELKTTPIAGASA